MALYRCEVCRQLVTERSFLYRVVLKHVARKKRDRVWEVCGNCCNDVQDTIIRLARARRAWGKHGAPSAATNGE